MSCASTGAAAPLLISALLALLAGAPGVSAEETEQYLVEYRAYNEALRTGDAAAAITHARAAWQAAEQSLGDDRLTAILAYNYGHQIVLDDTGNARAALRRARELSEAGMAELPEQDLRLYADYAEFVAGGFKRREANRLRDTLNAIAIGNEDVNPDIAPIWLSLAGQDIVAEQHRKALDSAAKAEAAILKLAPGASRGLAEAIMIGGIARLVPYPRTVEDVEAAHHEFARALSLFEPQEDLDSFDPTFATALTWDAAAGAALRTLGVEEFPDHEGPDIDEASRTDVFSYQADDSIDCERIEWLEREAPRFPRSALRKGYIGAVLVGFRLGDDFGVYDARVLAEVPRDTFGEAALESMKAWQVTKLPTGGPACNRNRSAFFKFVIES